MNKLVGFFTGILFVTSIFAQPALQNYSLEKSKIDYLVIYLFKHAEATSHAAKGKGECKAAGCEFLIAAPIKTFTSSDTNRDVNMLNVVHADKNPLVSVRVLSKKEIAAGPFVADLDVEFAGVKKSYLSQSFKVTPSATGFHVTGKFDLDLEAHKIERPSLMAVKIENLVPINFEMEWKKN